MFYSVTHADKVLGYFLSMMDNPMVICCCNTLIILFYIQKTPLRL